MPGEAGRRNAAPLTFFLSGFYGQGNLGDDLLLRAAIEGLKRVGPVRRFIVRNENDIPWVTHLPVQVALTGIDQIAADQTKSKLHRLASMLLAYQRSFRECDWLVFGGGTVFHERFSIVPLFTTFLICLLARAMGVRVAALGVGIATLQSWAGRALLRLIILLSDLFTVRDDAAMAECVKARAGNSVLLTSDLVFTMGQQLRAGSGSIRRPDDTVVVGVSVYSPALLDASDGDRVTRVISEGLQIILARGWRVALLEFHHRVADGDVRLDSAAFAKLTGTLPDQYLSQVTKVTLDASDMAAVAQTFAGIDLHCGMRFHGHVLSAIFSKPFFGISTDNKTDSICRFFGMPVIPIESLSPANMVEAIGASIGTSFKPAKLAACEKNSGENFVRMASLLGQPDKPTPSALRE